MRTHDVRFHLELLLLCDRALPLLGLHVHAVPRGALSRVQALEFQPEVLRAWTWEGFRAAHPAECRPPDFSQALCVWTCASHACVVVVSVVDMVVVVVVFN